MTGKPLEKPQRILGTWDTRNGMNEAQRLNQTARTYVDAKVAWVKEQAKRRGASSSLTHRLIDGQRWKLWVCLVEPDTEPTVVLTEIDSSKPHWAFPAGLQPAGEQSSWAWKLQTK